MRQFPARHRSGGGGTVIPYSTVAALPSTLTNTTGAVSPLGWTVDFFDDFTGTFTLTTSGTWNVGANQIFTTGASYLGSPAQYGCFWSTGGWGGYGPQVDNLNRVSMSASKLIMGGTLVSGVPQVSSAVMNFNTPWGYWEVRMKHAVGANGTQAGVANGIWLVSEPNWPQGGEFDVIEDGFGTTGYQSFLHCGPTAGVDPTGRPSFSAATLPSGSNWFDGAFHTYGALLTPAYLAMFIDGTRVWTTTSSTVLNNMTTATNPPSATASGSFGFAASGLSPTLSFSSNFFSLIFGLNWFGTTSGGPAPVAGQFPMQTEVDWIRHSVLNPATGGAHV
jgi:hypothetical protein